MSLGKVQFPRLKASQWPATFVLNEGEPGFETDTGRWKVGREGKQWSQLPYAEPILVEEQTANLTLKAIHYGTHQRMSKAGAKLLIPTDAAEPLPLGFTMEAEQTSTGAGQLTVEAVTPGTTTIHPVPTPKSRAQWSIISVIKVKANEWSVGGDTE